MSKTAASRYEKGKCVCVCVFKKHISLPVLFLLLKNQMGKHMVQSLVSPPAPQANPLGCFFLPLIYKLFSFPAIICFAYSYMAESERYE